MIRLINSKKYVEYMKFSGWFLAVILGFLLFLNVYPDTDQDLFYQKVTFPNGSYAYKIKIGPNNDIIEIGISRDGDLNYFVNYPPKHEQIISFFSNGVIQSKIKKDKNEETQGRAYYFNENSGNLSSEYNYEDGEKKGTAVSFHDSTGRIKEVMRYNDNGELYFRKIFDGQGNLIKTEGSE